MESYLTVENFHKAIEVALVFELLTDVVGTIGVDRLATVPLRVSDSNTEWRAGVSDRDIFWWIPEYCV